MDVRLARPTDAPLVLALSLDERAHLVRSPDWPAARSKFQSVARSVVPLAFVGRTWVARAGSSAGLLVASPRRYVIGWDIIRLVVRGQRDEVLAPLVAAVASHLQSKGVPRLFARCQDGAHEALQELGFRPLAREYVLVGTGGGGCELEPLPVESRYRMPQDAWPLHQLESETTPALVRHLEGLTSLDWTQGAKELREIVVEQDNRVRAWIGTGPHAGGGVQQIGLLTLPESKDLAAPLLSHVLDQATPGARFIARVRDYQPETVRLFLDAGFEVVSEEILMVSHGQVAFAPVERSRLRVARATNMQTFPLTAPRKSVTSANLPLHNGLPKDNDS